MSAATEALIAAVAAALPSSPLPSPLTLLSSPFPQIPSPPLPVPSPPLPLPPPTVDSPTYAKAPLGYRGIGVRLRAASPPTHHPSEIPSPPLLLPSTSHRDDIPEADFPPCKRLCLTASTPRFEVGRVLQLLLLGRQSVPCLGRILTRSMFDWRTHNMTKLFRGRESYSAAASRQAECPMSKEVGYKITDTWDDRDTYEIHVRLEDAQDDRALQRGRVNMLFKDSAAGTKVTTVGVES
ncbi:hypothetical protein Tco_1031588 [Tanacetum coccineum]|uniref:Uncharacterized protein n=1 Tax=Tanacetum coccineum TaxID=301880 RepID=A0ABQ5G9E4_9ASTR